MTRITCGWCGGPTANGDTCDQCGRDPRLAWTQRGRAPLEIAESPAGRPALDSAGIREMYGEAKASLIAAGRDPTIDAIAERLDRSPRTVRAWKQRFAL